MAECISPFRTKNNNGDYELVPCGKCPNCLKRKISGWSFRLMQEHKVSKNGYFITLTYDTTTVPISKSGFMELNKRDVQLFFKRLRKAQAKHSRCMDRQMGSPLKYYAVGEYGGRTMRPHYHAIIFNVSRELIQDAWNRGSVHYGEISEASVGYTLKYICKPSKVPLHKNDDRQKEFSLMSKNWVHPISITK